MTSGSSTLAGRVVGAAVAFVLTVALPAAEGLEQTIPCDFDPVERIVAIGDIHGAFDRFVDNLKATCVVDDELDWIGGTTHLVQTGDVLDRGPDSQKAMNLLIKLESQAVAAGGRVHALIGNHEFFNAVGELGYVSDKELEAFEGRRARELRKTSAAKGDVDARPVELALREAYSASGLYGQWIRAHNAVIRIGDLVFVHGGVTPEVAELGLCGINDRVRADLGSEEWAYSLSMKDHGPLLTRRYSGEDLTVAELMERGAEIRRVLETLGARTMVMGHTVTFGLVEPRFDGAAFLIDTGMFEGYLGGHQAALVVEGGSFYAVYAKGKVEAPASLAGEAGANYIEAAAAPKAGALKRQLAALRFRRGEYREAAALYESVGVLEARAPPLLLAQGSRRVLCRDRRGGQSRRGERAVSPSHAYYRGARRCQRHSSSACLRAGVPPPRPPDRRGVRRGSASGGGLSQEPVVQGDDSLGVAREWGRETRGAGGDPGDTPR